MSSVISVKNVTKRFRGCEALHGVDLQVPAGVVFALLGENGAGKTTLIRILTGFLQPDAGQAQVLGCDSTSQSLEIRRRIGYVADAPPLYDWMTAERIGWFTSAFYAEGFLPRYGQMLRHFEVPAGRRIKHMSKGQRAKVALALAVAHEPELLILDEPTSGLDPLVRRQFLESMVDRAAAGRTVLLSSHQISEVERVADWVAILHAGRVRVVAPLAELKQTVCELVVTLTDPLVEVATPAGDVLHQSRSGRQLQMIVRGTTDRAIAELQAANGVLDVRRRVPTLEEIFIACTRGQMPLTHDAPPSPQPAAHEPTPHEPTPHEPAAH